MIMLQNYEKFRKFAQLDLDTGLISFLGLLDSKEAKEQEVSGVYVSSPHTFVAFYRVGPRLFFRMDNQVLALDADIRCDLEQRGQTKTLRFLSDDELLLSWTYNDPLPEKWFEDDFTPMVKKEDFDLGLLIRNVLSNSGRIRRIFPDALVCQEDNDTESADPR